jgi:hypothetical protein
MSISFIFTFGPVPLTNELSPLAHAAALVRRREAESKGAVKPTGRPRQRTGAAKPVPVSA